MIEKLEAIYKKYLELTEKISDPEVISRMDEWQKIAKERADMEETVEKYREYKKRQTVGGRVYKIRNRSGNARNVRRRNRRLQAQARNYNGRT